MQKFRSQNNVFFRKMNGPKTYVLKCSKRPWNYMKFPLVFFKQSIVPRD